MWHGEGLCGPHECFFGFVHVAVFLCCLYASVPVVGGDFRTALHDVAFRVNTSELLEGEEPFAAALALEDAVTYGRVFVGKWSGLIVVVDEVEHGFVFAAIGSTVYPVVDDVVDEVEYAGPSYAWVSPCVVGPEVAHECGVLATDGGAEGMVPCVECLGRDGVLDGDVDGRFLLFWLAVVHIEHVAIEGDVLVESPFA